ADAVDTGKIRSDSVVRAKIAALAVDSSKLAAGSVDSEKIAPNAVNVEDIAAGAVTLPKLELSSGTLFLDGTGGSLVVGNRQALIGTGDIYSSGGMSLGNASVAPLSIAVIDFIHSSVTSPSGSSGIRSLFNFTPAVAGGSYYGIQNIVRDIASQTSDISSLYGVYSRPQVQGGTGGAPISVGNAYGFYAAPQNTSANASISNAYGFYATDPGGTGVITNAYGMYIQAITRGSTLNFGVYSAGGLNYFAGAVGVGTADPDYTLEVNGTFGGSFDGSNPGPLKVGYTATAPAGYYATYAP
ncbi:MAG: hypothetical protein HY554_03580, partial [Elusimicrobia bacterium]|nr:hypothetical protein [Elusimicrobiota bacterium]